jgi:hypothetical protein
MRFWLPSSTTWCGTAFVKIVDQKDHVPEIDCTVAVAIPSVQRTWSGAILKQIVHHIDHVPDVHSSITVSITLDG